MTSTRSRPIITQHPLSEIVAHFRPRWEAFRADVERHAPTANIGLDRIEQAYALNGKLAIAVSLPNYTEFVQPSLVVGGVPSLVSKHFAEFSSVLRPVPGGILCDPETFYRMDVVRRERLVEPILSWFGTVMDQHPQAGLVAESAILSAFKSIPHNSVPADVTLGEFRGAMLHCFHTPDSLFKSEWSFRVSTSVFDSARRALACAQRLKVSL